MPLPPPLPPPPLPVPVLTAPPRSAMKWFFVSGAVLTAIFLGLLTLLLLGLSTGWVALLGGMVLALLPVPFYMLLALWIDRFEKEPLWMLASAFVWGATVAVFFAYILNTLFGMVMYAAIASLANVATATLSAPFVEEIAKGAALVIFYFWQRDEFDNVLDGIIYAAMVGLGFAMTENILYYGQALGSGEAGTSIFTFIIRGVVSPFAHPLFTSMTGIGLGLARVAPHGSLRKIFAPAAGLSAAMFLHFLWNLSASLGAFFFVAYVLIMVPAFLGVTVLIFFSLRRESRIIREHLAAELQNGFLTQRDYDSLCTVRGRMRESWGALRRAGWRGGRTRVQFHDLLSELAFHRWRTARAILPRQGTAAAREAAYLERLRELKRRLAS